MPEQMPDFVNAVRERHPEVWDAYGALGDAVARAGPLDARAVRLVKLALAIGAGVQGGTHSHARRGLKEGLPREELEQVALLAITTLGWPSAMRGLAWIQDVTRPDDNPSEATR